MKTGAASPRRWPRLSDLAGARLQALSQIKYGLTLNAGQEWAGRLLLGSNNRIVAIQGVAGAGKSTVLKPVADILREEGRAVLGLAVQNTLVQMLERRGYSLDDGVAVPRTAPRSP